MSGIHDICIADQKTTLIRPFNGYVAIGSESPLLGDGDVRVYFGWALFPPFRRRVCNA